MNSQQTAQPLYSWIRGVDLSHSQLEDIMWYHSDEEVNWNGRRSFAFTPEGRYLNVYVDSGCEPCVEV